MPFYELGGISQYVIYLIRQLGETDNHNKYTIFHSRKDRKSYLPIEAENFWRRNLWTPSHHRLEKWSLAVEITPARLDVIHSPDFIPPAFGAKRRVITIHDLNFLHYPEYLDAESLRYYSDQIAWAAESADHIIADSEHTRQDLIELLKVSANKVSTVYLAANPIYATEHSQESVAATLAKYSLPSGFILFVGTLSPRKNITTLVAAYNALLKENRVDIPLVIVGRRGWQSNKVFTQIDRLNLKEKVIHIQSIVDDELAKLYSVASVLALPSYYEGFGLPALEAMHCGCPVVVSNRSSLPEIVGDAGLYCEPDKTFEWTEALFNVISDSDLTRKLKMDGKKQARKFSWALTAQKTLPLYLGL